MQRERTVEYSLLLKKQYTHTAVYRLQFSILIQCVGLFSTALNLNRTLTSYNMTDEFSILHVELSCLLPFMFPKCNI